MQNKWPSGNENVEGPPPRYEDDKAWTKERQERAERLWKTVNADDAAKREHSKETLHALRDLIEECIAAVKKRPDVP